MADFSKKTAKFRSGYGYKQESLGGSAMPVKIGLSN